MYNIQTLKMWKQFKSKRFQKQKLSCMSNTRNQKYHPFNEENNLYCLSNISWSTTKVNSPKIELYTELALSKTNKNITVIVENKSVLFDAGFNWFGRNLKKWKKMFYLVTYIWHSQSHMSARCEENVAKKSILRVEKIWVGPFYLTFENFSLQFGLRKWSK